MGVRLDSRRDPDEDRRRVEALPVQLLEPVQFVERIHHDALHPGLERHPQLGHRFVVSMHDHARAGYAGLERNEQLATGGYIEAHALFMGHPGHLRAHECFGGVVGVAVERVRGCPAAAAEVLLVVDEERRPELVGQPDHIASCQRQTAVWGYDG